MVGDYDNGRDEGFFDGYIQAIADLKELIDKKTYYDCLVEVLEEKLGTY